MTTIKLCLNCKEEFETEFESNEPLSDQEYNFCPYCGNKLVLATRGR